VGWTEARRLGLCVCLAACAAGMLRAADVQTEGRRPGSSVFARAPDLHMDIGADARTCPVPAFLGGSTVRICLGGEPLTPVLWDFGYAGTSLGHGAVNLDEAGSANVAIVLPEVRHRAACEFLVATDKARAVRVLVLYPASRLKEAAERVRWHRIGVHDPSGEVQRALRDEGVVYEDLSPRIARDFFSGGLVILAGFRDPDTLAEACRRLDSRVRGGMSVLLLNPPPGWSGWGVRRVEVKPAVRAAVRLHAALGPFISDADVGAGPWAAVLEASPGAAPLAWCEGTSTAGGTRPAAQDAGAAARALALAQPVGRGRLMVSLLPQTESPCADAIGRGLLEAMVLWAVEPPVSVGQLKEEIHA